MKKQLLYISILVFSLLGFNANSQSFDNFYNGISKISEGNYLQAIEYFDKAISDKLDNGVIIKYKAECYYALDDINSAIIEYKKLKEFNVADASYGLAICYSMNGETESAIQELRIHLAHNDKNHRGDVILDKHFLNIKDSKEWDALWMEEWYNKYDQLFEDAKHYFEKEDYDRAFELLEDLIDRKPRNHKAFALRAEIYQKLGDLRKSKDDYSKAISLKKKVASYYEGRAIVNSLLGKHKNAYKDYKSAFEYDKYNPEYIRKIAEELYLMEEYTEAQKELSVYLSFFGNDEEGICLAGKCCFVTNQYTKAIEQFSRALEVNQSAPEYYLRRGNCYLVLENFDKADIEFAMALDLDPDFSSVYISRGLLNLVRNEDESACRDFNKAYDLGNNKALELIQEHCNR